MPTVVSIFADRSAADSAAARLGGDGVAPGRVHVRDVGQAPANDASIELDELATGGLFHNIGELMDRISQEGHDPRDAGSYDEAVRMREAALLVVEAGDEAEAARVESLLRAAGARRVARR